MKAYKAYILDLDGTLYRGEEPIPGAVEAVRELHERGAAVRYLTNNAGRTRAFYRDKLCRMGFPAEEADVYSSATGTAAYLRSEGLETAFVVGMPGLVQTLVDAGISVVNADGLNLVACGEAAQAVVVGICLDFTYALLDGAMQQILAGARFVASNPDTTFPLEGSRLAPGAGSLVAAVQACSGVEPFIVGKPNPFLIQLILQEAGLGPSQVLVVGDRLDTDIESGRRAGCDTHLVLTGVERVAPEGQSWSPDLASLLSSVGPA